MGISYVKEANCSTPVTFSAVVMLIVLHVAEDTHSAGPVAALHLSILPN